MASKDNELNRMRVRLVVLEKAMEALQKMHEASNDQNFIGMMKHVLDHNKKIKDLTNENPYLQTQLMALEEQTQIKRPSLSRMASRYKHARSAISCCGTTSGVSIGK